jgi:cytidylate kinase
MLIIFGGLPGTGKSTLTRQLAERLRAVYLRIGTIERAVAAGDKTVSIDDKGYQVGYAQAEERAAVGALEIEIIYSDQLEHRRRIETRVVDIPVTWDEVVGRNDETWIGNHVSIDTAGDYPELCDLCFG